MERGRNGGKGRRCEDRVDALVQWSKIGLYTRSEQLKRTKHGLIFFAGVDDACVVKAGANELLGFI